MRKLFSLFLFALFLGLTSFSQAKDMPESERTIRLSVSADFKKDPKYVYYFLRHLDRWYLQLTPDHKRFTLLNSQELNVGTQIENEEASQGQYVKHLYTVTQFDENTGVFQMVSPISRAVVWHFFQSQNKTILTIKIKDNGNGTCSMTSNIELVFASKGDKEKAVFFKVDKVWQKHLHKEMTKAIEIIELLTDFDRPLIDQTFRH
jgi:hypothetical protein